MRHSTFGVFSDSRTLFQPNMPLTSVGFCGIDDSVEPLLLAALSAQHPYIEWGILFREDKKNTPRYASDQFLTKLKEYKGRMRLAGHLCADAVNRVLLGDADLPRRLADDYGVKRYQLNATVANGCDVALFGTDEGAERVVENLRAVCEANPTLEFIVQRNAQTRALWERLAPAPPRNLSFLYDESMGFGTSPESWPAPERARDGAAPLFGYAGGLSPANIVEQLGAMVASSTGLPFWIDMESSLRTELADGSDAFDVNKASQCIARLVLAGVAPSV